MEAKKEEGTVANSCSCLWWSGTSRIGLLSPRAVLRQGQCGGRSVGSEESPSSEMTLSDLQSFQAYG